VRDRDRQADRQTDGQMDGQRDREIAKHRGSERADNNNPEQSNKIVIK
jgi:hypothetical protein